MPNVRRCVLMMHDWVVQARYISRVLGAREIAAHDGQVGHEEPRKKGNEATNHDANASRRRPNSEAITARITLAGERHTGVGLQLECCPALKEHGQRG